MTDTPSPQSGVVLVIRLTTQEIQSGHDRQKWAEGLILQLPDNHDGRNSWLINYGTGEEAQAKRLAWNARAIKDGREPSCVFNEDTRSTGAAAPAPHHEAPASAVDDLVDRFAVALKEKLRAAAAKYGHDDAWVRDDWRADLVRQLGEHVQKGDPRDVAAYCAFAWHHGWSVSHEAPASDREREPLCMAYKTGYAEGVEDSNGMFDRESCEEGWGQYAEKLSAQPALPARLPLPTVDDGRGGRRPINPQDDR